MNCVYSPVLCAEEADDELCLVTRVVCEEADDELCLLTRVV